MCGGSYVGRGMRHGGWRHAGGREFMGRDVEKMSPGARISAALSVLLPVGLSGVFLVAFVPSLWWIFTTYFWVAFPAFGLLRSGIAALGEGRPVRVSEERELLEAIRESGEISAAAAAARTSLTVAEADRRLRELAENGHIEVRARGGGVFYALWGNGWETGRRIEDST
jgi:DNA-binding transcriptional ArsR family regulator